jgi:hypothetical protein
MGMSVGLVQSGKGDSSSREVGCIHGLNTSVNGNGYSWVCAAGRRKCTIACYGNVLLCLATLLVAVHGMGLQAMNTFMPWLCPGGLHAMNVLLAHPGTTVVQVCAGMLHHVNAASLPKL